MVLSDRLSQPPRNGESHYQRLVRLSALEREHSRALYRWTHPDNIGWARQRKVEHRPACRVVYVEVGSRRPPAPRAQPRPTPAPRPVSVSALATHATAAVPAVIHMEGTR